MMEIISQFPEEYGLSRRYIDHIILPDVLFGQSNNADVFVKLKNGQIYSFTAFTPDGVREMMVREHSRSFISPGLIMVAAIDQESVLDAVENCLRLSQGTRIALDHFGILQV